jgi:hypothetical protein
MELPNCRNGDLPIAAIFMGHGSIIDIGHGADFEIGD